MKKRQDPHQLTIDRTTPQAAGTIPADRLPDPIRLAKSIRARHVGIPVESETAPGPLADAWATPTPTRTGRAPATPPVPEPLASAIADRHFGLDDEGKAVRPAPDEVRAITERHAEKLVGLLDNERQVERSLAAPVCSDRARLERTRSIISEQIAAVTSYAESFGQQAADRLAAYARRQLHTERRADLNLGDRRQ